MNESHTFFFFRSGHSDAGDSASRVLDARDQLGGKGASLHALAALGYRVPSGFTIPTDWSTQCHEGRGKWPCTFREELRRSVTRLEEITGRRLGAESPLNVAVRSGASESMPGMMDTVLDVSSYEAIENAVDQVFRSFWSERAVAYRCEKGIVGLAGTAVTVQEMCPAEFAGVVFTVEPGAAAEREEIVVIEAVRGLGEGLVSGSVTPDRYSLERPGLELVECAPAGPRPLLDGEQLRSVAACAVELESRFGYALDVEWAIRDGEVWLLQARAVRRAAGTDPEVRLVLTAEARRLAAGRNSVFARHNLDETLSFPTPMSWDLHRRFFQGREGFLGLYRDLGFHPSERVVKEGFLALIGGRVYSHTDRAAEVFYGSDLVGWDHEAVRRNPSLVEEPPRDWSPGASSPSKVLRALLVTLRSARRQRRLRSLYPRRFEQRALPAWSSWVEKEETRDLSELLAPELLRVLEERVGHTFGRFPREALLLSYLAGVAYAELEDFLERRLGSPAGCEAARTLAGSVDRESEHLDLARVARGELALDAFLERWGHRTAGEMELARPRWREEPGAIEELARALEGSSDGIEARCEARQREVRGEEERVVRTLLEDCGTAAADELHERLEFVRSLIPWRQNWKHHWMRGLDLVRQTLVRLDNRLGLEGQVFWLELDELRRVVAVGAVEPSLRTSIRKRHEAARLASSWSLPGVLDSRDLERIERIERGESQASETAPSPRGKSGEVQDLDGRELPGTAIAAGRSQGRAWICDSPERACPFPPPFVLVCSSTDPGWTPILARAAGLVVEQGGTLSHGAIVCRDFGVPAVVVSDARRLLRPGEEVCVDGDRGIVRRDVANGDEVEADPSSDRVSGLPRIPAEPWVPPVRRRLALRVASGLAAALAVSLAIVGVPALGDALRPVARFACDWTVEVGATPFLSVAWAAALAAVCATMTGILVVDRGQLRAMRDRIAWYRRGIRRLRKSGRAAGAERAAADLVRRSRQASTERTLELMRPIGWTFLPFVLAYLWVSERFPAEPLRPGTTFEVRATFQPTGEHPLRYVRLDIDEPSRVRLLDDPWRKLTPNRGDPERGPYRVVWAAEACDPGPVRLTVTAGRERLEEDVVVTEGRRFSGVGATCGKGEIAALDVDYPPVYIELPTPVFRAANALSKWITGGRELEPRDIAGGPLATFLVLAVIFALVFQRGLGVR